MPPDCIRFCPTIVCHRRTDAFIGAEFGLESFGSAPNTKNKNSISQVFWNGSLRGFQPIFPTIKVYQQNHESIGVTIHSRHVIRRESFQHLILTARHWKHLHLPLSREVKLQMKAVC